MEQKDVLESKKRPRTIIDGDLGVVHKHSRLVVGAPVSWGKILHGRFLSFRRRIYSLNRIEHAFLYQFCLQCIYKHQA